MRFVAVRKYFSINETVPFSSKSLLGTRITSRTRKTAVSRSERTRQRKKERKKERESFGLDQRIPTVDNRFNCPNAEVARKYEGLAAFVS